MAYKTIEIQTPQNVVISYELATGLQRIMATIIDVLGATIINLILYWIFGVIGLAVNGTIILVLIVFLINYFYHLLSESLLNGRSLGKMALGLRVIKCNGQPLKFSDLFLRWALRLVEITFTAGLLGLIVMYGSERRQRLGDIMAGTTVVVNRPSLNFSLHDIIRLHTEVRQEDVKFPEVKHIDEKHLLYIKNLMSGRNNYSHAVYQNALREASDRIGNLIGFNCPAGKEQIFLEKVITDYIALTR